MKTNLTAVHFEYILVDKRNIQKQQKRSPAICPRFANNDLQGFENNFGTFGTVNKAWTERRLREKKTVEKNVKRASRAAAAGRSHGGGAQNGQSE